MPTDAERRIADAQFVLVSKAPEGPVSGSEIPRPSIPRPRTQQPG